MKKKGGVKFDTILTSKGSGYRLHFKGCLSVSELKFWGFFRQTTHITNKKKNKGFRDYVFSKLTLSIKHINGATF